MTAAVTGIPDRTDIVMTGQREGSGTRKALGAHTRTIQTSHVLLSQQSETCVEREGESSSTEPLLPSARCSTHLEIQSLELPKHHRHPPKTTTKLKAFDFSGSTTGMAMSGPKDQSKKPSQSESLCAGGVVELIAFQVQL